MRRAARTPFVALVTPYSYARTQRLADELETLGYETMIIDHPSLADRALEADACVIVLTPDGWRDPAIMAVMRERPAAIIPVLAAPMEPPRAAWSSDPIPMRGSAREVAEAIADAVDAATDPRARSDGYGRSNPGASFGGSRPGAGGRGAGPSMSRPRGAYADTGRGSRPNIPDFPPGLNGGFGVPGNAAAKPAKKPASAGRSVGILLTVLVVLGGLGYGGYHYRTKLLGKFFPQQASGPNVMQPYTAAIPGPTCDKGKGQWALPKDHAFFTTVCQTNALLMTQTKSATTLAEIDFLGTGLKMPQAYHMQVAATITTGDQHTFVGMIVHHQTPTGGHVFIASSDSSWNFQVEGQTGSVAPPSRRGFLSQATKTFTLAVDVSGAVMTFSINGKAVTHVTESSYTTSDSVALLLGTGNPKAKLPLAAQFSQFQFTPQPDPTLSTADALATAEATNNAIPKAYTAAAPGPGCDKGAAQWAKPSVYDETGITVTCQSSGVQLTAPASNGGDIGFYGIKGTLIKDTAYSVAVTITPANQASCGGVTTYDSLSGGYIYVVCGDGSFGVYEFDATTNKTTQLDIGGAGSLAPGGPYTLNITENSPSHTLKLNTFTRPVITDKNQTQTDHITLFALGTNSAPSTVTFSNFTFTNQS